jgi:four helix bundle protein
MNKAKSFKDLIVWQRAHALVLATYQLTRRFPKEEMFCLTTQMRRSAFSVPANIAEGFRKRGLLDKTRILNIAQGSLEELRYYFILTEDLGYQATGPLEAMAEEVSRLLVAYASAIDSKTKSR